MRSIKVVRCTLPRCQRVEGLLQRAYTRGSLLRNLQAQLLRSLQAARSKIQFRSPNTLARKEDHPKVM